MDLKTGQDEMIQVLSWLVLNLMSFWLGGSGLELASNHHLPVAAGVVCAVTEADEAVRSAFSRRQDWTTSG